MKSPLHIVTPKRKPDTRVGLLNASFVYTRAAETDIRKTFERAKRELAKGKS